MAEIPPFAVYQVLESGRMWFASGRPIHAESEKCEGFDAAIVIANAKRERFRFEAQSVTHEPTIEASVTELLLEACRIQDEEEQKG